MNSNCFYRIKGTGMDFATAADLRKAIAEQRTQEMELRLSRQTVGALPYMAGSVQNETLDTYFAELMNGYATEDQVLEELEQQDTFYNLDSIYDDLGIPAIQTVIDPYVLPNMTIEFMTLFKEHSSLGKSFTERSTTMGESVKKIFAYAIGLNIAEDIDGKRAAIARALELYERLLAQHFESDSFIISQELNEEIIALKNLVDRQLVTPLNGTTQVPLRELIADPQRLNNYDKRSIQLYMASHFLSTNMEHGDYVFNGFKTMIGMFPNIGEIDARSILQNADDTTNGNTAFEGMNERTNSKMFGIYNSLINFGTNTLGGMNKTFERSLMQSNKDHFELNKLNGTINDVDSLQYKMREIMNDSLSATTLEEFQRLDAGAQYRVIYYDKVFNPQVMSFYTQKRILDQYHDAVARNGMLTPEEMETFGVSDEFGNHRTISDMNLALASRPYYNQDNDSVNDSTEAVFLEQFQSHRIAYRDKTLTADESQMYIGHNPTEHNVSLFSQEDYFDAVYDDDDNIIGYKLFPPAYSAMKRNSDYYAALVTSWNENFKTNVKLANKSQRNKAREYTSDLKINTTVVQWKDGGELKKGMVFYMDTGMRIDFDRARINHVAKRGGSQESGLLTLVPNAERYNGMATYRSEFVEGDNIGSVYTSEVNAMMNPLYSSPLNSSEKNMNVNMYIPFTFNNTKFVFSAIGYQQNALFVDTSMDGSGSSLIPIDLASVLQDRNHLYHDIVVTIAKKAGLPLSVEQMNMLSLQTDSRRRDINFVALQMLQRKLFWSVGEDLAKEQETYMMQMSGDKSAALDSFSERQTAYIKKIDRYMKQSAVMFDDKLRNGTSGSYDKANGTASLKAYMEENDIQPQMVSVLVDGERSDEASLVGLSERMFVPINFADLLGADDDSRFFISQMVALTEEAKSIRGGKSVIPAFALNSNVQKKMHKRLVARKQRAVMLVTSKLDNLGEMTQESSLYQFTNLVEFIAPSSRVGNRGKNALNGLFIVPKATAIEIEELEHTRGWQSNEVHIGLETNRYGVAVNTYLHNMIDEYVSLSLESMDKMRSEILKIGEYNNNGEAKTKLLAKIDQWKAKTVQERLSDMVQSAKDGSMDKALNEYIQSFYLQPSPSRALTAADHAHNTVANQLVRGMLNQFLAVSQIKLNEPQAHQKVLGYNATGQTEAMRMQGKAMLSAQIPSANMVEFGNHFKFGTSNEAKGAEKQNMMDYFNQPMLQALAMVHKNKDDRETKYTDALAAIEDKSDMRMFKRWVDNYYRRYVGEPAMEGQTTWAVGMSPQAVNELATKFLESHEDRSGIAKEHLMKHFAAYNESMKKIYMERSKFMATQKFHAYQKLIKGLFGEQQNPNLLFKQLVLAQMAQNQRAMMAMSIEAAQYKPGDLPKRIGSATSGVTSSNALDPAFMRVNTLNFGTIPNEAFGIVSDNNRLVERSYDNTYGDGSSYMSFPAALAQDSAMGGTMTKNFSGFQNKNITMGDVVNGQYVKAMFNESIRSPQDFLIKYVCDNPRNDAAGLQRFIDSVKMHFSDAYGIDLAQAGAVHLAKYKQEARDGRTHWQETIHIANTDTKKMSEKHRVIEYEEVFDLANGKGEDLRSFQTRILAEFAAGRAVTADSELMSNFQAFMATVIKPVHPDGLLGLAMESDFSDTANIVKELNVSKDMQNSAPAQLESMIKQAATEQERAGMERALNTIYESKLKELLSNPAIKALMADTQLDIMTRLNATIENVDNTFSEAAVEEAKAELATLQEYDGETNVDKIQQMMINTLSSLVKNGVGKDFNKQQMVRSKILVGGTLEIALQSFTKKLLDSYKIQLSSYNAMTHDLKDTRVVVDSNGVVYSLHDALNLGLWGSKDAKEVRASSMGMRFALNDKNGNAKLAPFLEQHRAEIAAALTAIRSERANLSSKGKDADKVAMQREATVIAMSLLEVDSAALASLLDQMDNGFIYTNRELNLFDAAFPAYQDLSVMQKNHALGVLISALVSVNKALPDKDRVMTVEYGHVTMPIASLRGVKGISEKTYHALKQMRLHEMMTLGQSESGTRRSMNTKSNLDAIEDIKQQLSDKVRSENISFFNALIDKVYNVDKVNEGGFIDELRSYTAIPHEDLSDDKLYMHHYNEVMRISGEQGSLASVQSWLKTLKLNGLASFQDEQTADQPLSISRFRKDDSGNDRVTDDQLQHIAKILTLRTKLIVASGLRGMGVRTPSTGLNSGLATLTYEFTQDSTAGLAPDWFFFSGADNDGDRLAIFNLRNAFVANERNPLTGIKKDEYLGYYMNVLRNNIAVSHISLDTVKNEQNAILQQTEVGANLRSLEQGSLKYKFGKDAIGIFAVFQKMANNTSLALGTATKLHFDTFIRGIQTTIAEIKADSDFMVKYDIEAKDLDQAAEAYVASMVDESGESVFKRDGSGFSAENKRLSTFIDLLLNFAVDDIKEDSLSKLGLRKQNINLVTYFILHPHLADRLITQHLISLNEQDSIKQDIVDGRIPIPNNIVVQKLMRMTEQEQEQAYSAWKAEQEEKGEKVADDRQGQQQWYEAVAMAELRDNLKAKYAEQVSLYYSDFTSRIQMLTSMPVMMQISERMLFEESINGFPMRLSDAMSQMVRNLHFNDTNNFVPMDEANQYVNDSIYMEGKAIYTDVLSLYGKDKEMRNSSLFGKLANGVAQVRYVGKSDGVNAFRKEFGKSVVSHRPMMLMLLQDDKKSNNNMLFNLMDTLAERVDKRRNAKEASRIVVDGSISSYVKGHPYTNISALDKISESYPTVVQEEFEQILLEDLNSSSPMFKNLDEVRAKMSFMRQFALKEIEQKDTSEDRVMRLLYEGLTKPNGKPFFEVTPAMNDAFFSEQGVTVNGETINYYDVLQLSESFAQSKNRINASNIIRFVHADSTINFTKQHRLTVNTQFTKGNSTVIDEFFDSNPAVTTYLEQNLQRLNQNKRIIDTSVIEHNTKNVVSGDQLERNKIANQYSLYHLFQEYKKRKLNSKEAFVRVEVRAAKKEAKNRVAEQLKGDIDTYKAFFDNKETAIAGIANSKNKQLYQLFQNVNVSIKGFTPFVTGSNNAIAEAKQAVMDHIKHFKNTIIQQDAADSRQQLHEKKERYLNLLFAHWLEQQEADSPEVATAMERIASGKGKVHYLTLPFKEDGLRSLNADGTANTDAQSEANRLIEQYKLQPSFTDNDTIVYFDGKNVLFAVKGTDGFLNTFSLGRGIYSSFNGKQRVQDEFGRALVQPLVQMTRLNVLAAANDTTVGAYQEATIQENEEYKEQLNEQFLALEQEAKSEQFTVQLSSGARTTSWIEHYKEYKMKQKELGALDDKISAQHSDETLRIMLMAASFGDLSRGMGKIFGTNTDLPHTVSAMNNLMDYFRQNYGMTIKEKAKADKQWRKGKSKEKGHLGEPLTKQQAEQKLISYGNSKPNDLLQPNLLKMFQHTFGVAATPISALDNLASIRNALDPQYSAFVAEIGDMLKNDDGSISNDHLFTIKEALLEVAAQRFFEQQKGIDEHSRNEYADASGKIKPWEFVVDMAQKKDGVVGKQSVVVNVDLSDFTARSNYVSHIAETMLSQIKIFADRNPGQAHMLMYQWFASKLQVFQMSEGNWTMSLNVTPEQEVTALTYVNMLPEHIRRNFNFYMMHTRGLEKSNKMSILMDVSDPMLKRYQSFVNTMLMQPSQYMTQQEMMDDYLLPVISEVMTMHGEKNVMFSRFAINSKRFKSADSEVLTNEILNDERFAALNALMNRNVGNEEDKHRYFVVKYDWKNTTNSVFVLYRGKVTQDANGNMSLVKIEQMTNNGKIAFRSIEEKVSVEQNEIEEDLDGSTIDKVPYYFYGTYRNVRPSIKKYQVMVSLIATVSKRVDRSNPVVGFLSNTANEQRIEQVKGLLDTMTASVTYDTFVAQLADRVAEMQRGSGAIKKRSDRLYDAEANKVSAYQVMQVLVQQHRFNGDSKHALRDKLLHYIDLYYMQHKDEHLNFVHKGKPAEEFVGQFTLTAEGIAAMKTAASGLFDSYTNLMKEEDRAARMKTMSERLNNALASNKVNLKALYSVFNVGNHKGITVMDKRALLKKLLQQEVTQFEGVAKQYRNTYTTPLPSGSNLGEMMGNILPYLSVESNVLESLDDGNRTQTERARSLPERKISTGIDRTFDEQQLNVFNGLFTNRKGTIMGFRFNTKDRLRVLVPDTNVSMTTIRGTEHDTLNRMDTVRVNNRRQEQHRIYSAFAMDGILETIARRFPKINLQKVYAPSDSRIAYWDDNGILTFNMSKLSQLSVSEQYTVFGHEMAHLAIELLGDNGIFAFAEQLRFAMKDSSLLNAVLQSSGDRRIQDRELIAYFMEADFGRMLAIHEDSALGEQLRNDVHAELTSVMSETMSEVYGANVSNVNIDSINGFMQSLRDKLRTGEIADLKQTDHQRLLSQAIRRYSVFEERQSALSDNTYSQLVSLLDGLKQRFNIPYRLINDPTAKGSGRFEDGVVFINLAKANEQTVWHEYAHPFLDAIRADNSEVYDGLVTEMQNSEMGRSVIAEAREKGLYSNLDSAAFMEEMVVETVARMVTMQRSLSNAVQQGDEAAAQRLLSQLQRESALMLAVKAVVNAVRALVAKARETFSGRSDIAKAAKALEGRDRTKDVYTAEGIQTEVGLKPLFTLNEMASLMQHGHVITTPYSRHLEQSDVSIMRNTFTAEQLGEVSHHIGVFMSTAHGKGHLEHVIDRMADLMRNGKAMELAALSENGNSIKGAFQLVFKGESPILESYMADIGSYVIGDKRLAHVEKMDFLRKDAGERVSGAYGKYDEVFIAAHRHNIERIVLHDPNVSDRALEAMLRLGELTGATVVMSAEGIAYPASKERRAAVAERLSLQQVTRLPYRPLSVRYSEFETEPTIEQAIAESINREGMERKMNTPTSIAGQISHHYKEYVLAETHKTQKKRLLTTRLNNTVEWTQAQLKAYRAADSNRAEDIETRSNIIAEILEQMNRLDELQSEKRTSDFVNGFAALSDTVRKADSRSGSKKNYKAVMTDFAKAIGINNIEDNNGNTGNANEIVREMKQLFEHLHIDPMTSAVVRMNELVEYMASDGTGNALFDMLRARTPDMSKREWKALRGDEHAVLVIRNAYSLDRVSFESEQQRTAAMKDVELSLSVYHIDDQENMNTMVSETMNGFISSKAKRSSLSHVFNTAGTIQLMALAANVENVSINSHAPVSSIFVRNVNNYFNSQTEVEQRRGMIVYNGNEGYNFTPRDAMANAIEILSKERNANLPSSLYTAMKGNVRLNKEMYGKATKEERELYVMRMLDNPIQQYLVFAKEMTDRVQQQQAFVLENLDSTNASQNSDDLAFKSVYSNVSNEMSIIKDIASHLEERAKSAITLEDLMQLKLLIEDRMTQLQSFLLSPDKNDIDQFVGDQSAQIGIMNREMYLLATTYMRLVGIKELPRNSSLTSVLAKISQSTSTIDEYSDQLESKFIAVTQEAGMRVRNDMNDLTTMIRERFADAASWKILSNANKMKELFVELPIYERKDGGIVFKEMIASSQLKGTWRQNETTGRWEMDIQDTMMRYNISEEKAAINDFIAQKVYDHLVDSLLLHDIQLRKGRVAERNIYALIENEHAVEEGRKSNYSPTVRQQELLKVLNDLREEMRKGELMKRYSMGLMPSLSQRSMESIQDEGFSSVKRIGQMFDQFAVEEFGGIDQQQQTLSELSSSLANQLLHPDRNIRPYDMDYAEYTDISGVKQNGAVAIANGNGYFSHDVVRMVGYTSSQRNKLHVYASKLLPLVRSHTVMLFNQGIAQSRKDNSNKLREGYQSYDRDYSDLIERLKPIITGKFDTLNLLADSYDGTKIDYGKAMIATKHIATSVVLGLRPALALKTTLFSNIPKAFAAWTAGVLDDYGVDSNAAKVYIDMISPQTRAMLEAVNLQSGLVHSTVIDVIKNGIFNDSNKSVIDIADYTMKLMDYQMKMAVMLMYMRSTKLARNADGTYEGGTLEEAYEVIEVDGEKGLRYNYKLDPRYKSAEKSGMAQDWFNYMEVNGATMAVNNEGVKVPVSPWTVNDKSIMNTIANRIVVGPNSDVIKSAMESNAFYSLGFAMRSWIASVINNAVSPTVVRKRATQVIRGEAENDLMASLLDQDNIEQESMVERGYLLSLVKGIHWMYKKDQLIAKGIKMDEADTRNYKKLAIYLSAGVLTPLMVAALLGLGGLAGDDDDEELYHMPFSYFSKYDFTDKDFLELLGLSRAEKSSNSNIRLLEHLVRRNLSKPLVQGLMEVQSEVNIAELAWNILEDPIPSFSYAVNMFKSVMYAGAATVGFGNEVASKMGMTEPNDYGFIDESKAMMFFSNLAPGGKAIRETLEDYTESVGLKYSNEQLLNLGYTQQELFVMDKTDRKAAATRMRNKYKALLNEGIEVEQHLKNKQYKEVRAELNRLYNKNIKPMVDQAKAEKKKRRLEEFYE